MRRSHVGSCPFPQPLSKSYSKEQAPPLVEGGQHGLTTCPTSIPSSGVPFFESSSWIPSFLIFSGSSFSHFVFLGSDLFFATRLFPPGSFLARQAPPPTGPKKPDIQPGPGRGQARLFVTDPIDRAKELHGPNSWVQVETNLGLIHS